ncbi:MAG: YihY/virulence factor BrkB family protein [Gemmobacter sp.]|nr:YihY/virulence factor BrkB family protein [Gemmobacter sp.]
MIRRCWRYLVRLNDLSASRHLGLIAAGVAFFGVLAIFPAVAALVAIWGLFADRHVVADNMANLDNFLPRDAFELLNGQVMGLVEAEPASLGWATAISLGAALWSARAGMAALVQGINAVFGQETRGGVRHQVVALILTLAMVAAALIALTAGVLVPLGLGFVPLGSYEAGLMTLARWAIAPLATVLGVGLVYRYGPSAPGRRPPLFSIGLLVAVALWLAVSEGFAFYLSSFGTFNKIYGSIGAVAALLMWVYLSAWAVLMGAAVNALRSGRVQ